jgi:hypothetical protein
MDRGRVGEDRGSKETDGCPLTSEIVPVGHSVSQGSIRIMDVELGVHWSLSRRWKQGSSDIMKFTLDLVQPRTMAIIDRATSLEPLVYILPNRSRSQGIVVSPDILQESL